MQIHTKFSKKRNALLAALFLVSIGGGFLTACTLQPEAQTSSVEVAEEETVPEEPPEEPKEEKPINYIKADDDLSNLQLDDPTKPVFDAYTLDQRLKKGLPTVLPAITPYNKEKIAYLTFDDGPDARNTPKILDILKENGIHATFYVLGTMAEENPDVLKRIFEEGHAIGNHSYDHDYDNLYASKENFLAQIKHNDNVIYSILGVRPLIIRAPGGTVGMFSDDFPPMLKENGYVEHDWNVSSQDATPGNPLADELIYNVDWQTNGDLKDHMALVLMHSTGAKDETVRALPGIIQVLKDKGYRFGVVTPMTPQPW